MQSFEKNGLFFFGVMLSLMGDNKKLAERAFPLEMENPG
jgi:hypothetical protein